MTRPVFQRLRGYFTSVGEVLRGQAAVSSIFPNTTDIGLSREGIYAEFLRQHVPAKCHVFLGGFLFDEKGDESKQLDIIVTTDTTPRFHAQDPSLIGKSLAPVEGTLGVVSVKSTLDGDQLENALLGFASIPPTQPLGDRIHPDANIKGYDNWPFKILYASKGILLDTLGKRLVEFYSAHLPPALRTLSWSYRSDA